jgi:hypothetical protein
MLELLQALAPHKASKHAKWAAQLAAEDIDAEQDLLELPEEDFDALKLTAAFKGILRLFRQESARPPTQQPAKQAPPIQPTQPDEELVEEEAGLDDDDYDDEIYEEDVAPVIDEDLVDEDPNAKDSAINIEEEEHIVEELPNQAGGDGIVVSKSAPSVLAGPTMSSAQSLPPKEDYAERRLKVPAPTGLRDHVFISHAQSTGGDQANALYLELTLLGFSVWYDNRAKDLTKVRMSKMPRSLPPPVHDSLPLSPVLCAPNAKGGDAAGNHQRSGIRSIPLRGRAQSAVLPGKLH